MKFKYVNEKLMRFRPLPISNLFISRNNPLHAINATYFSDIPAISSRLSE